LTGALLKELSTYPFSMQGVFQAHHMKITVSSIKPLPNDLFWCSLHLQFLQSPHEVGLYNVWLKAYYSFFSTTERMSLSNLTKQGVSHSSLTTACAASSLLPHSLRLFWVVTEFVKRNLTVLGEFSKPHLISQVQKTDLRNKLRLHKYCCYKAKRKIIIVKSQSPMPILNTKNTVTFQMMLFLCCVV
jgi:hypothetical protein